MLDGPLASPPAPDAPLPAADKPLPAADESLPGADVPLAASDPLAARQVAAVVPVSPAVGFLAPAGAVVPVSPVLGFLDPARTVVPGQRAPLPLESLPPVSVAGQEPQPRRRRLLVGVAALLVVLLAVATGIVVHAVRQAPLLRQAAAPTTGHPAIPLTPFEAAIASLKAQSEALLRGDETGWLAVVDPAQPKLRARYRNLYRTLRALDISYFHYHPYVRDDRDKDPRTITVGVDIAYCFGMPDCPDHQTASGPGAPQIAQELRLRTVAGRYVITRLGRSAQQDDLQPTPWEAGDLVFARGKRVTLAAPRSEAGRLRQVLPVADKAAAIADRFARYVRNPQRRYRVYLGDEKNWKHWYGGDGDKWTVGLTVALRDAESDVVLRADQLVGDPALLATTLRHELGHVATISGVPGGTDDTDLWLIEGIAEYIGWYPRHASASWRRPSVHAVVHAGHRFTTIAAPPLRANATLREDDAFYGLGQFAADCMAQKYGQRKLFDFVRLRLRERQDLDSAARTAFGKPFATVDRGCVAWIRARA